MTRHHLTDTELLDLHFHMASEGAASEHVAACATCQARRRAVGEMLGEVSAAAARETDAAFAPEVLVRQHARIMGRVATECRPARIISFPATSAPSVARYPRSGSRWVAAAVAAGVILGLVGEHVTQRIARTGLEPRPYRTPAVQAINQPGIGVAVRAVSTGSDDEFYGQVELAFGSAAPATLRPLDVLTPRAWEVRE
jgi:hypothetical protein